MIENQQFGPWATMFDTGPRARLSTFWKRRMAMLPSTASAEKTLSRRVRFLLLLAACAALSAPTVYLFRGPQARADEPTPATSAVPVDVPMIEPAIENPELPRSVPNATQTLGPIEEQTVQLQAPEASNRILYDNTAPPIEERVTQEQREVDGKVETIERRFQVAVTQTATAPKASHKIEFLPELSANEEKILQALSAPTKVDFSETPFSDVIDFLREKHGIEIELDRRALSDAVIESDTPITLQATDVPLRSVLRRLLSRHEMTFFVDDDALSITSKEVADSTIVTRAYPVGDLIHGRVASSFDPHAVKVQEQAAAAAEAAKVSEGRGSRAISRPPDEYSRLVSAITETILPDSWSENKGIGAIVAVPESRSLVISQTHAAHDDVVRLLRALRAARAIGEQAARDGQPVIQLPGPAAIRSGTYPGPNMTVSRQPVSLPQPSSAPLAPSTAPSRVPPEFAPRSTSTPTPAAQRPANAPNAVQYPSSSLPNPGVQPAPSPTPRAAPTISPNKIGPDDKAKHATPYAKE